eukprot:1385021-Pyramimonas_sp.AAC.1
MGASLVARSAAPICGTFAPQLSCLAPPLLTCPSCVCVGAGGQLAEGTRHGLRGGRTDRRPGRWGYWGGAWLAR